MLGVNLKALFVGFGLVACGLVACDVSAQAFEDSVGSTCENFKKNLPPNVRQGMVEVPEDWSQPQGRKTHVFYYSVPAPAQPDAIKGNTPVVFFNGGPGADSHSSYMILKDPAAKAHIPLVFLDQRGTGCSDAFPAELSEETAVRLAHYGSRAIVQDAEFVRRLLFGAAKWSAFGQSFGGDIVHRYAMTAPEGLEAAFSHGASVVADPMQWGMDRIRSQARVAESYFEAHPEDRARVTLLRRLITDTTCFNEGGNHICGNSVLDAATSMLGFRDSWDNLHFWLGALVNTGEHGILTLSTAMLKEYVETIVFGIYGRNALPASVISKLEMVPGLSDAKLCKAVLARLTDEGETPLLWAFNECRFLPQMHTDADHLIDGMTTVDAMTPQLLQQSLASNPGLRFFLYSGGKDIFSPVESFAEEVQVLGKNITYREFPASGHDGFYAEAQIWEDLVSGRK